MRITNNMIMNTTKSNINRNKNAVNKGNTQMSTQKKIDVPSDDPVIAVRALRLRSTLNQIDQYLNTNVNDAEAWLDVTQSSLSSVSGILEEMHTLCNDAANGVKTQSDRNTILTQIKQLRDQIYHEGDEDYAGRTIFTGYKTNTTLTFQTDSTDSYEITQNLSYADIEEKRYYEGTNEILVDIPTGNPAELKENVNQRIRLSYDNLSDIKNLTFSYVDDTGTRRTASKDITGGTATVNIAGTNYTLNTADSINTKSAPDTITYCKATGELILGDDVAKALKQNKVDISVTYNKTGFQSGEIRPEHYFNCTRTTDPANPVEFVNYTYNNDKKTWDRVYEDINYYIGNNQTITVNTLAANTFNASIYRDVNELADAVQFAISSYDAVEQIKKMQSMEQYSSEADQKTLSTWLAAAEKQFDYAQDNMEKLYGSKLTTFAEYQSKVDLALTDLGSKGQRLDLVKNRLESQNMTVKELKSSNEDKDLSDVVIDYTAAYTAYQAALQAASKVQERTLLDYL